MWCTKLRHHIRATSLAVKLAVKLAVNVALPLLMVIEPGHEYLGEVPVVRPSEPRQYHFIGNGIDMKFKFLEKYESDKHFEPGSSTLTILESECKHPLNRFDYDDDGNSSADDVCDDTSDGPVTIKCGDEYVRRSATIMYREEYLGRSATTREVDFSSKGNEFRDISNLKESFRNLSFSSFRKEEKAKRGDHHPKRATTKLADFYSKKKKTFNKFFRVKELSRQVEELSRQFSRRREFLAFILPHPPSI
ncbi:hypothetical protein BVC80_9077g39 [Macleaya cordata]|uniref:Uncharacterized protein n=1 Tax=Macleaya cordata TaxID=56857 RepID=A0A200PLN2_MACCD|nr:hypothetical protein BVC80_9077g39 [Macleaya cordata]